MKGIKLLAAGVLFTAAVQAQTAKTNAVSFGIRAGVNFQNINGKNASGGRIENGLIPRINAGITADVPFADDFYLQPGLFFAGKGADLAKTGLKTRLSYLDIPVVLLYKPVLGKGHLLLGGGPYIGFAIAGNSDLFGDKAAIKFKNSVTQAEYDSAPYARRLDAGANLQTGYEFKNKLSLQLNAQLGLQRINPTIEGASGNEGTARNTGFGLSVGYRF